MALRRDAQPRPERRRFVLALVAMLSIAGMLAAAAPSNGATSGTTVGAQVLGATEIDAAGCAAGTAGATEFGAIAAGTGAVTSADCVVTFGSTNLGSQLRMHQTDGARRAMYRAATGELDTDWSGDGRASLGGHLGYRIVPYGDGSFVSVGEANTSGWEFQAARWNANGSLAWQSSPVQAGCDDCMAYDVAVLEDGDILIVGEYEAASNDDLALMRLNANGSLDTDFATVGYTRLVRSGEQRGYSVVEQPGVGYVVAGTSSEGGNLAAFVVRYLSDGSLDTSFGVGGMRILQLSGGVDRAYEVALQDDGSLIVAGLRSGNIFVTRLTPDGAVDTSFGVSGTRTVTSGTSDRPMELRVNMTIDPRNDDILVTAESGSGASGRFVVGRMDRDGTMVSSFGTNGVATHDIEVATGYDEPNDILVAEDGSIYVGMTHGTDTDASYVLRLHEDGALDTSFGTNGEQRLVDGVTDGQYGTTLAMDSDGRLVALAMSSVLRLSTQTLPDFASGSADWVAGSAAFGGCLRDLVGGATDATTWDADPGDDCTAVNTDPWEPIAAAQGDSGAKVALRATPGSATAHLRFGLRSANLQAAGRYVAPLTFTVLAPST